MAGEGAKALSSAFRTTPRPGSDHVAAAIHSGLGTPWTSAAASSAPAQEGALTPVSRRQDSRTRVWAPVRQLAVRKWFPRTVLFPVPEMSTTRGRPGSSAASALRPVARLIVAESDAPWLDVDTVARELERAW
jgi:hypothetical protein